MGSPVLLVHEICLHDKECYTSHTSAFWGFNLHQQLEQDQSPQCFGKSCKALFKPCCLSPLATCQWSYLSQREDIYKRASSNWDQFVSKEDSWVIEMFGQGIMDQLSQVVTLLLYWHSSLKLKVPRDSNFKFTAPIQGAFGGVNLKHALQFTGPFYVLSNLKLMSCLLVFKSEAGWHKCSKQDLGCEGIEGWFHRVGLIIRPLRSLWIFRWLFIPWPINFFCFWRFFLVAGQDVKCFLPFFCGIIEPK